MKTKSIGLGLGIGVWALAALGCGAQDDASRENAFLAGVPEEAALQLSITDDASAEALATEDDQVGAALSLDELGSLSLPLVAPSTPADGLTRPRAAVQELNQALRDFLQPIAALVRRQEPDEVTGNVAQWGPVTRGTTEYRFFVRRGILKRFGWLLQARPDGSSAEFANVAAGGIRVGTRVRRGHGVAGVDLDALADVDPTVNARGKVLAAFAHGPAGTALAYGLHDFTRADDSTPVDAAFQQVHLASGFNRVRLAFHGNLPETASAAEELVLARVRHQREVGGRADLLVTGGDIANGKVWLVSECWNTQLGSTYRSVRECPGDGIGGARCVEQLSKGEPSACARELATPEFPPADAEQPMADAESPEGELLPPTEMPSGDAPTD